MFSIDAIQFGILSPEIIREMSVCEVITDELYLNNQPNPGGLRDPKFGVSTRRGVCSVCGKMWSHCSGHFGYYTLPLPLYAIGWMPEVLQWLRRTCVDCGCVHKHPIKKKCTRCNRVAPKVSKANSTTLKIHDEKGTRELFATEAHNWLLKVKSEDVATFRPGRDAFHPSHLILTLLPIPPNCVRPSPTMDGDEVRGEDDLTRKLLYVIRVSKGYKKILEENSVIREHASQRVQDAVHAYLDQTRMNSKFKATSKSISERLRGKQGRIRGTLMGKRCNYTARTVITGDAMIDMREVGVPEDVAKVLTVTEHVNRLNYETLREQIASQDPRIKTVLRKDGTRFDLKTMRGQIDLQVGMSVERQLRNGDPVLFNRQPSLHRMSIMCHKAKILKGKTFRLNLSCTTPYNADFDGDEMNLHALQTHESRADALELMSVAYNIVTPQSNRPVMGIVQDSLLSAFMMTSPGVYLDKAMMCTLVMWVKDAVLPEPESEKGWTGLQCMSMLFPKDFQWKDYIVDGKLLKGPLGKKALGRSHGSIIHRLYNDYGPDRTCQFINELQRINHVWFSTQGFSIGIGDMRITNSTATDIRRACADVDKNANEIKKVHGKNAESKINRMLNQTRDSMGLIAQKAMEKDNCLGLMVKSGSKGSMVNILQIMACVGQQNCSGKRMQATLGGRTLPMFKAGEDTTKSKGFVKHSYIDGLTPDEYWFHTVGGREGLIDTAVKTSTSGYIQRRLVKSLESVHVANDTTVRDSLNRVIQFRYGEDGLDGMCHEMVGCIFDQDDALTHYSLKDWPEIKPALHMWSVNAKQKLGERWAVTVPAARICKQQSDAGHCSVKQKRCILQPLLDDVSSRPLIHAYVLSVMARKDFDCSESAFQRIVNILTKKWHRSIVAPGEMVGTIAAQSVGEPTTQMTLNTFHNAGNSAKNVTLGVPRFEELINASKKIKTPYLTVTSNESTTVCPEKAWKLKTELKRTRLLDIIISESYKSNVVKDDALQEYLRLPDNRKWDTRTPPKYILKCTLSRKKILQNGVQMFDMLEVLRAQSYAKKVAFAYSDPVTENPILYMRCKSDNGNFFQHVKNAKETTIKGSPHLTDVHIRSEGKSFLLDTEGIDLNFIRKIEAIEHEKTICNDIFAIRNTYGVEAARRALLKEIHAVLSFDGSYVNIRHLMIIVDWMTWRGHITALTRHGVKKMMDNTTPLKRATFEQPVEIFHNAACKGLYDELKGVSEQLLVGKNPQCGSHFNGVVTETSYQEQWDNDDWRPPDPMDLDDGEGADTWMPQQRNIASDWDAHTTFADNNNTAEFMNALPQTSFFDVQQPQQPAWQQPQQPAWQQPQQPAWQQSQQPAWQQSQQPAVSPQYAPGPVSPQYAPGPVNKSPTSPAYSPTSPAYSPTSPIQSDHSSDSFEGMACPTKRKRLKKNI